MTAAHFRVGQLVRVKTKQRYDAPRVAEHASKTGRVTKVAEGGVTVKLEPTRTGITPTGVVRGRCSQGLRLTVGHNDLEKVEK